MPLLYLTSFLQLIYTYFSDKNPTVKFFSLRIISPSTRLALKCSKRPKYYDQKVESIVQYTLHAAVIMHLIFAIFYGEGSLFDLVNYFKHFYQTDKYRATPRCQHQRLQSHLSQNI